MKNKERIERALPLKSIIEGEIPKDPILIARLRKEINDKILHEVREYTKQAKECYRNGVKYLIYSNGTIVKEKVKIRDFSGRIV